MAVALSACHAANGSRTDLVAYQRDLIEADHLYLARCSTTALMRIVFNDRLPFKTGLDLTIDADGRSALLVWTSEGQIGWEIRFLRAGAGRAVVSLDAAASHWGDDSGIALVRRVVGACADRWKPLQPLHKS